MDPIERRIRAARPISGNRHLPLTDRAKRELADLLILETQTRDNNVPRRHPPGRPRRGPLSRLWVVAAVVIALAFGAGTLMATRSPSSHLTHPAPTPTSSEAQPMHHHS